MKYSGWDIDYIQNKETYHEIFDKAMVKEVEGSTEELESQIKELTGRKYAVAVSSATDALRFSLEACGIGPGDEVIVSSFSWISTSSCINMVGATPVFCDIGLDSYHLSANSIQRMMTPKTKAVIYTHLYGNMTDTTEIEELCKQYGMFFIEDSAQSVGCVYQGRPAGSIGDCSSFSFNGNKVVAGISGGGMFMTDNEDFAKYVRKVRRHGKDKDFEVLGTNSKMFITNADVISYRLTQLDKWTEQRNEIAQFYIDELGEDFIVPKMPEPGNVNNWHKFVIRFDNKNERKKIKDVVKNTLGINLSVHYEKLLYANNLYNNYEYRNDMTPNAEIAVNTVLSLPIHPWLDEEELDKLCTTLLMAL